MRYAFIIAMLLLAAVACAQEQTFRVKKKQQHIQKFLVLPRFVPSVSGGDTANTVVLDSLPAEGTQIILWNTKYQLDSWELAITDAVKRQMYLHPYTAKDVTVSPTLRRDFELGLRPGNGIKLTVESITKNGKQIKTKWVYYFKLSIK